MGEPNYAVNIIATLAGLPEFLRRPMLRARVSEFSDLSAEDKSAVIRNALDASPTIPFDVFAKLLYTWLEIVSDLPDSRRRELLESYAEQIVSHPESAVRLHLDGIVGVFASLPAERQDAISATLRGVLDGMGMPERKVLLMLMPDSAKGMLGL